MPPANKQPAPPSGDFQVLQIILSEMRELRASMDDKLHDFGGRISALETTMQAMQRRFDDGSDQFHTHDNRITAIERKCLQNNAKTEETKQDASGRFPWWLVLFLGGALSFAGERIVKGVAGWVVNEPVVASKKSE